MPGRHRRLPSHRVPGLPPIAEHHPRRLPIFSFSTISKRINKRFFWDRWEGYVRGKQDEIFLPANPRQATQRRRWPAVLRRFPPRTARGRGGRPRADAEAEDGGVGVGSAGNDVGGQRWGWVAAAAAGEAGGWRRAGGIGRGRGHARGGGGA